MSKLLLCHCEFGERTSHKMYGLLRGEFFVCKLTRVNTKSEFVQTAILYNKSNHSYSDQSLKQFGNKLLAWSQFTFRCLVPGVEFRQWDEISGPSIRPSLYRSQTRGTYCPAAGVLLRSKQKCVSMGTKKRGENNASVKTTP